MMLRTYLLVAATLLLTAAVVAAVLNPLMLPIAVVAAVLVVAIAFKRKHYGAIQPRPTGGAWRETRERFIDPASGKPVAIWFDATTGERRYVEIDRPGPE